MARLEATWRLQMNERTTTATATCRSFSSQICPANRLASQPLVVSNKQQVSVVAATTTDDDDDEEERELRKFCESSASLTLTLTPPPPDELNCANKTKRAANKHKGSGVEGARAKLFSLVNRRDHPARRRWTRWVIVCGSPVSGSPRCRRLDSRTSVFPATATAAAEAKATPAPTTTNTCWTNCAKNKNNNSSGDTKS